MPVTVTFNGQTYNAVFSLNISLSPPIPKVLGITFTKGPGMAALLGLIHLTQAPLGVTSRPVTIQITAADGSNATVTTVDMIDPRTTFACNEGDTGTATPSDVNAVGTSLPGEPFPFTAAITITDVPPAPQVTGASFAPAASPKKRK